MRFFTVTEWKWLVCQHFGPFLDRVFISSDEEGWVKLPGTADNILDYEIEASLDQPTGYAEYLDTTMNAWVATGSVPVPLSNDAEQELGPAILLTNGKVLQIGANGAVGGDDTNTALYDPTTNSWAAGPFFRADQDDKVDTGSGSEFAPAPHRDLRLSDGDRRDHRHPGRCLRRQLARTGRRLGSDADHGRPAPTSP